MKVGSRLSQLYRPEVPNLHGKPKYTDLEKAISKSPVLMIRHAVSTSNKASSEIAAEAAK